MHLCEKKLYVSKHDWNCDSKSWFFRNFFTFEKKLQPIRIENNNFYRETSMISTNRNDFLGIWTRESTSKTTYICKFWNV